MARTKASAKGSRSKSASKGKGKGKGKAAEKKESKKRTASKKTEEKRSEKKDKGKKRKRSSKEDEEDKEKESSDKEEEKKEESETEEPSKKKAKKAGGKKSKKGKRSNKSVAKRHQHRTEDEFIDDDRIIKMKILRKLCNAVTFRRFVQSHTSAVSLNGLSTDKQGVVQFDFERDGHGDPKEQKLGFSHKCLDLWGHWFACKAAQVARIIGMLILESPPQPVYETVKVDGKEEQRVKKDSDGRVVKQLRTAGRLTDGLTASDILCPEFRRGYVPEKGARYAEFCGVFSPFFINDGSDETKRIGRSRRNAKLKGEEKTWVDPRKARKEKAKEKAKERAKARREKEAEAEKDSDKKKKKDDDDDDSDKDKESEGDGEGEDENGNKATEADKRREAEIAADTEARLRSGSLDATSSDISFTLTQDQSESTR